LAIRFSRLKLRTATDRQLIPGKSITVNLVHIDLVHIESVNSELKVCGMTNGLAIIVCIACTIFVSPECLSADAYNDDEVVNSHLPPQLPAKIRELKLPEVRGRRISNNKDCDSEQYLDKIYAQASNVFIGRVIESIPSDILQKSRTRSNQAFLHIWLKSGWKKPMIRKQDFDMDYDQLLCWRSEQPKVKANQKYLFYLKDQRILDYLLVDDAANPLAKKHLQNLGVEDWYFNRVNNLILSKQ